MTVVQGYKSKLIKSPLNYIGGKTKLLNQILPLFPKDIGNFVDLFAGGCNVGINANANKIYCNDNLIYLIEMYKVFQLNDLDFTINFLEMRIKDFDLSLSNEDGYKQLRSYYNRHKNPLDLFVLIAFSFNHQIRFNNRHEFNNPFGRERSSFNARMKLNLEQFITRIKEKKIIFSNICFEKFDFSELSSGDFVYCDPPYLITTGTYNDGKRGFKGWTEAQENALLTLLDNLDGNNVRFALSNVLEHNGNSNHILKKWLAINKHYKVNIIDSDYSNSNYQTKGRNKIGNIEVLITNYKNRGLRVTQTSFDELV